MGVRTTEEVLPGQTGRSGQTPAPSGGGVCKTWTQRCLEGACGGMAGWPPASSLMYCPDGSRIPRTQGGAGLGHCRVCFGKCVWGHAGFELPGRGRRVPKGRSWKQSSLEIRETPGIHPRCILERPRVRGCRTSQRWKREAYLKARRSQSPGLGHRCCAPDVEVRGAGSASQVCWWPCWHTRRLSPRESVGAQTPPRWWPLSSRVGAWPPPPGSPPALPERPAQKPLCQGRPSQPTFTSSASPTLAPSPAPSPATRAAPSAGAH